jgi:hypothetical protein
LALVLIGGLLSSTIFVLTITPAVYGMLERLGRVPSKAAAPGPPVGAAAVTTSA